MEPGTTALGAEQTQMASAGRKQNGGFRQSEYQSDHSRSYPLWKVPIHNGQRNERNRSAVAPSLANRPCRPDSELAELVESRHSFPAITWPRCARFQTYRKIEESGIAIQSMMRFGVCSKFAILRSSSVSMPTPNCPSELVNHAVRANSASACDSQNVMSMSRNNSTDWDRAARASSHRPTFR